MPLRVLVDTNLLVSFLLAPQATDRTIVEVIQHGWNGDYTLLMPEDLLDELGEKLATKPYLRQHISARQAQTFTQALRELAELLSPLPESIPRIVRDADDDYLLAAALYGEADVLVSGDLDLLALRERLAKPYIVSPAEFLQLLAAPPMEG